MPSQILIVEDNQTLASSLKRALEIDGFAVHTTDNTTGGLAAARQSTFDVVLTDLQFTSPTGTDPVAGLALIQELHTTQPRLPVILMTAHHTTQAAIEATKLGAYEYILKPFVVSDLLGLIRKALAGKRLMSDPVELGTAAHTGDAIIGNSRSMQTVYKEVGRFAAKPVTVLIRGATGTGKELIARALYQHSNRADKPFIIINCAAIPETLLESELFGHEQGAFTGATTRRIGRFEQANHGTLFLDEIGDISPGTQAKLLRVLQEKTIQRLGGKDPIQVDVRILAATHRDLEQAIHDKQFRQDLYYRLNDALILLPPLRDRADDIPLLVDYFLRRHGRELGHPQATITTEAGEFLQRQPWHGNVRELENVIRKALLASHGFVINLDTVTAALASTRRPKPTTKQPLGEFVHELLTTAARGELTDVEAAVMEAVERELYGQALAMAGGNQAKAAKWLGVSRPTMREKLKSLGLRSPDRI
ncbi:MAG: sigma-54 dependent transcriptional regulator [Verrucomicrobiota bacterium]